MEHFVEATLSIVSTIVTAIISYLMYRLQRHQENKDAEEDKGLILFNGQEIKTYSAELSGCRITAG